MKTEMFLYIIDTTWYTNDIACERNLVNLFVSTSSINNACKQIVNGFIAPLSQIGKNNHEKDAARVVIVILYTCCCCRFQRDLLIVASK